MDKEREIFLNYIKDRVLRNTSQREVILETFLSAKQHVTADDLFGMLRRKHPEIGYATMHRNLRLIWECGLAEQIKIGDQKTRYEKKVGHGHHDHLVCVKCGELTTVHDDKIEKLLAELATANEFAPQRYKVEIYGTCKKCK